MDYRRGVLSAQGRSMNSRALDFLDRWEADHVEPVPADRREQEARHLAAACREDAIRAGIAIVDLQRAAKGDLVQNMLDALEAAALRGSE